MSPKVIEKYSTYRREQILHASWDCFAELGYKKTTLRSIAKRMNASTGVIYTYFKGKDELIDALLLYNSEKSSEMIRSVLKQHKGEGVIKELFETSFEQLPIPHYAKMVRGSFDLWTRAMEKKKARNILSSSWLNMQKSIEQVIEKGIKKGEFDKDISPRTMAGFIVAVFLGLQIQIMLMSETLTPSYLDEIKKTTLQTLKKGGD